MKFYLITLAGLIFSAGELAQEKNKAHVFLPGIVSVEGNDFNACFSINMKTFYFSRTIGNRSVLYFTSQVEGVWSKPEPLTICKPWFSCADPALSPDGALYFISDMPSSPADTTRDYDIWKSQFNNGKWDEPVNVTSLNSPSDEYYISFTKGGDVYFSSNRPGGFGEEDIYVARRNGNSFDKPVNLGPNVNTIFSEYDPFISQNEDLLVFASSGRQDSYGKADLYWVKKGDDWGKASHFESGINTPGRDYCPYISPDDGSFFFSSNGDVNVVSRNLLPKHF